LKGNLLPWLKFFQAMRKPLSGQQINILFRALNWISDVSSRQIGINSGDITDKFLKENIGHLTNPVIFDVGANIGEFSYQCLHINSSTIIYAFEPQVELAKELQAKLPISSSIFSVALSDSVGKMEFSRRTLGDRKAHMREDHELLDLVVKKSTVDAFVTENSIKHIDLLKIDTEGHDFKVLLGAKNSLQTGKIGIVIFEIMPRLLVDGTSPKMIEDFLRSYGYNKFFRITPHLGLMPLASLLDSESRTQNIVCFRKISQVLQ
jgi:FkbM family methyltransferase